MTQGVPPAMSSWWPRTRLAVTDAPRWWACGLAGLGHALLMGLAFAPLGVWPVAAVAIWPLVWVACRGARRPVRTAMYTALGVIPLWSAWHVWLIDVTAPGYPGLAAYMTLYPALFVWALGVARTANWPVPLCIVVPVLWTGLEVLRGDVILTGYSFYMLGHPLIENYPIAAPAAVLGAHAVTFLTAAIAGCLADAAGWSGLPRKLGGAGAVLLAVSWMMLSWLGARCARIGETFDYRVSAVQTNLPQSNKLGWSVTQKLSDFARFADLTKMAASGRPAPDLLIWPETMFPGYALNPEALKVQREDGLYLKVDEKLAPGGRLAATHFADELVKLQNELKTPMLVGAIAADGLRHATDAGGRLEAQTSARYNSALLVSDGSISRLRYDKVELTPFGESIPYLWRWPELQQKVVSLGAAGMAFDLSMGKYVGPLGMPLGDLDRSGRPERVWVATPICFEATRPGHVCRLVQGDGSTPKAQLIINLSNDGWFGESDAGRATHMLAARWRCVELGLPMVRAVNTGISAIIDRRGKLVSAEPTPLPGSPAASTRADGVVSGTIALERVARQTIFARVGEWPAWIVVGLAVVGTVIFWIKRRVQARLGG